MSRHVWDADIGLFSAEGLLKRLTEHPVRIPMLQMRDATVTDLRERGFIVCGQEMVNCCAIHAHDGDVIISGEPSLFCWIVIKTAGRQWLEDQLDEKRHLAEVKKIKDARTNALVGTGYNEDSAGNRTSLTAEQDAAYARAQQRSLSECKETLT